MQKLLLAIALVGLSFSSGNLFGENATGMSASSTIAPTSSAIREEVSGIVIPDEEEVPPSAEENHVAPPVEEEAAREEEPFLHDTEDAALEEETDEVETETAIIESDLTYDQIHQRDVGEADENPPSPEEIRSWYDEGTAEKGRALVLAAYDVPEYSFIIDSCPSNYVYQYEFYADSPNGDHVNLIGIYQYDATGDRTFHLDPVTGVWE